MHGHHERSSKSMKMTSNKGSAFAADATPDVPATSEAPTAPKIVRRYVLENGAQRIGFVQIVEDFMPRSTFVERGAGREEVPAGSTVAEVGDRCWPGDKTTAVLCRVQLAPKVEVVLPVASGCQSVRILDHKYQEEATVTETLPDVGSLDAEALFALAEGLYLQHTGNVRDPYQREDRRTSPLEFKHGSLETLRESIIRLCHAFPRIYTVVSSPRIFVFSEHDGVPASVAAHFWAEGKLWQPTQFFLAMLTRIVEENTPVGYRYVTDSDQLVRRSRFRKDAIVLTIAPPTPTPDDTSRGQAEVWEICARQGIILDLRSFQNLPLHLETR